VRPDDLPIDHLPDQLPHSRPRYHLKETMAPRRFSRSTIPSLALSAVTAVALSAVVTAVIAPQSASAADPLPDGSTLVLSALGSSTPGMAQAGTVTLTAPDDTVDTDPNTPGVQGDPDTARDALVDQDVTLSVDHGFFTTGAEKVPSVVGATAGNLAQLGTSISEKTDTNGEVSFQVGIERDPGFDDDGHVSTEVTAQAGGLIQQGSAEWSSANPLNGQVEVVLSPSTRQENPVAPAVSGDRTWYDVFTRDQFGNPVDGEPVYLDFAGKLDDFDYSEDFVTSDLGREGDFWVVSFVPGDLTVTGTWNAPSYRYTSTAGAATSSMADVSGGAPASFYDVDFNATSFGLAPSTSGEAAVGTSITQIATVVDQRGNPVRGFEVRFFRFGPESGGGEGRADQITNGRGQASYSFVGAEPGIAKVTAVVSDGVSHRTLVSEVRFRFAVSVVLTATKGGAKTKDVHKSEAAATDELTVRASKVAAGAKVSVYRVKGSKLKRVKAKGVKLDADGKATFAVRDRNGRRKTTYVVVVAPTPTTFAATSPALKTR
jgi:hypothetical protein